MRRFLTFAIASVLAAGGFAAPAKIATQEWVKKALAGIGVRVSTSTVETNITASATGGAQTNIVFTSPYTCEEVPQCRSISFTVSPAKTAYRQAMTPQKRSLLDLLLLKAYADGQIDTTVYMTIQSGYWTDAAGNMHMFLFDGGWTVELQDDVLPDPPTGQHVCEEFDINCVCKNYGVSPSYFEKDPGYQQYADIGASEFYSTYGSFTSWINLETWGMYDWQKTKTGPRGTEYFVQDVDGLWFNVQNIFERSDAIIDAMATTIAEINRYMKNCREDYVELNTCKKNDPQHQWEVSSCGVYTWKKCKNNPEHTEGSARHSYPGKSVSSEAHACVCGTGPEEPHGVLIPDVRTETDKGWIETRICPKECGYFVERVHEHHFTNCGTCDAGDDCTAPCKGCGGAHKFIKASADACAPCECEWSQDCKGTPPATDMSLHSAWLPCGEDTEGDNDWLEAKGAHCQCQCKAFGHIARTEHDYKLGGGFAPFESIAGDDKHHYRRLGECTRCGQHKKQKETHVYPEEPTSYTSKGSEVCEKVFVCTTEGCGHVKRTEGCHKYGVTVEWINVSDKICRAVSHCQNCGGVCHDDSQGHSTAEKYLGANDGYTVWERYCKNGCGWSKTVNRDCSHAKYSEWYKVGEVVGGVIMEQKCQSCAHKERTTVMLEGMEKCNTEVGIHLPLEDDCGCECGHHGSGAPASEDEFHKWESDTKCRCKCGEKHIFRKGGACSKVCADCKEINQYGFAAKESDHTKTTEHRCGCKCGYYGVSAEHVASGHNAETAFLHNRAFTGADGSPMYCQCYGAEGKGGEWHWRNPYPKDSCSKICQNKGDDEPLGHLAAKSDPEKGIVSATVANHTPKTYGCGCKCGLCGDDTKSLWADNKALHKPKQNAEDECHCSCEKRELVGTGEGGHTYKNCTCTCGEKHNPDWVVNMTACGYCPDCGYIWRNGQKLDASNPANHIFNNGECYCAGNCQVNGARILHPDGHFYEKNKCVCNCNEERIEHIFDSEQVGDALNASTCFYCGAVFTTYQFIQRCMRCDYVNEDHYGTVGGHASDCGKKKGNGGSDVWHCWKCGCPNCQICKGAFHFCNACCKRNPPKPPRTPPGPEPDPPPTEDECPHFWERQTWDNDWNCDECGAAFHCEGYREWCKKCGWLGKTHNEVSGAHNSNCPYIKGENGEDPPHECNETNCGETLAGGGKCNSVYCSVCNGGCPNASNHANHHGGNGNSGGDGDGDINDIITIIR